MRGMLYSADQMKAARQRTRLTQKELAGQLGMKNDRSIVRWEREGLPEGGHYVAALEAILHLRDPEPEPVMRPDLSAVPDVEFWLEAVRRASLHATTPDAPVQLPTRDRTWRRGSGAADDRPGNHQPG